MKNNQNSRIKKKIRSENFDFYKAFSTKRIESWMSEDYGYGKSRNDYGSSESEPISLNRDIAADTSLVKENLSQAEEETKKYNSSTTYRLSLTDYWFEWQQAAKRANFDFDLLNDLFDARAVRFYELTKLWRVISDNAKVESFINKDLKKTSKSFPGRMEIGYETFATLMPIPYLRSENEIKQQIIELIKPLKVGGYVKSFALKSDWRGFFSGGRLVFSFRD